MIYVVLGMHKSGTTLVARLLHTSGINMGEGLDDRVTYAEGNTYERAEAVRLNEKILSGCLVWPLHRRVFRAVRRSDLRGSQGGVVSPSLSLVRHLPMTVARDVRAEMQRMVRGCDREHADWGFKDPRSCLTYHLWRKELPPHRVIVVFRHYAQLLQRYRNSPWRRFGAARFYRILHAWTTYNRELLRLTDSGVAPSLVIQYERLMNDPAVLARLEEFVQRPLSDVREQKSYRHRQAALTGLPPAGKLLLPFLPADPDALYRDLVRRSLPIGHQDNPSDSRAL